MQQEERSEIELQRPKDSDSILRTGFLVLARLIARPLKRVKAIVEMNVPYKPLDEDPRKWSCLTRQLAPLYGKDLSWMN